jgi:8-oxo-dGTP pyrophosphatase MutT (NUDIX family)
MHYPEIYFHCGGFYILRDKDMNYLLTRRPAHMSAFPKCWVFPGGMVDKGSQLESEAIRELHEEVGIDTKDILEYMKPIVLYGNIHYDN